jgi:hypothetical protein
MAEIDIKVYAEPGGEEVAALRQSLAEALAKAIVRAMPEAARIEVCDRASLGFPCGATSDDIARVRVQGASPGYVNGAAMKCWVELALSWGDIEGNIGRIAEYLTAQLRVEMGKQSGQAAQPVQTWYTLAVIDDGEVTGKAGTVLVASRPMEVVPHWQNAQVGQVVLPSGLPGAVPPHRQLLAVHAIGESSPRMFRKWYLAPYPTGEVGRVVAQEAWERIE